VTSTVDHRCYRIVTVVMDDDVISPKIVATEGHNSDRKLGDIMEEPL
jgi:hypothetical protein